METNSFIHSQRLFLHSFHAILIADFPSSEAFSTIFCQHLVCRLQEKVWIGLISIRKQICFYKLGDYTLWIRNEKRRRWFLVGYCGSCVHVSGLGRFMQAESIAAYSTCSQMWMYGNFYRGSRMVKTKVARKIDDQNKNRKTFISKWWKLSFRLVRALWGFLVFRKLGFKTHINSTRKTFLLCKYHRWSERRFTWMYLHPDEVFIYEAELLFTVYLFSLNAISFLAWCGKSFGEIRQNVKENFHRNFILYMFCCRAKLYLVHRTARWRCDLEVRCFLHVSKSVKVWVKACIGVKATHK